jgi:hypothetical protein
MRKVVFLTMIALLLSAPVMGDTVFKDGDPGFYWGFLLGDEGLTAEVVPGEAWTDQIALVNWSWTSGCGTGDDTLCIDLADLQGWGLGTDWEFEGVPNVDVVWTGYIWTCNVTVTVPCSATPGQTNTVTATGAYTDINIVCQPDSGGCPGGYGGSAFPLAVSQDFLVVPPPPTVTVYQDTLFYVEEGLAAGYVPFGIANDNYCYALSNFSYTITSKGHIGSPISDSGSGSVGAGEIEYVYTIIDASLADACDYDTLEIIAWNATAGDTDTCIQVVHVIEPAAVPLFTAPVVTIMVLAMILAAAVIMRRHAVSKA